VHAPFQVIQAAWAAHTAKRQFDLLIPSKEGEPVRLLGRIPGWNDRSALSSCKQERTSVLCRT
jgi:hypothetical protein